MPSSLLLHCFPLKSFPSKSITLDSWTREQINSLRAVGNTASNAIYNPNESLHPPPSSRGGDERDSEMEKYVRRKYESEAFKPGAGRVGVAPTSLNRARERNGREVRVENQRNPELNELLVKETRERELPALPMTVGVSGGGRPRRMRTGSAQGGGEGQLIDFAGGSSSTLPLQINLGGSTSGGYPQQDAGHWANGGMNGWATSMQPQHQQQQQQQQQPSMGYSQHPNGTPHQYLQHAYSAPAIPNMNGFDAYQQFQEQQGIQHQNYTQQQAFPQQQQLSTSPSPSSFHQQSYFPHPQFAAGSYTANDGFLPPQNTQPQQNPYGQQVGGPAYFQQQPGMQMGMGLR